MSSNFIGCLLLVAAMAMLSRAQDATPGTVLFLSDNIDKPSQVFLDAFSKEFASAGPTCKALAVDAKSTIDLASYSKVLLYSAVMAFDQMSPVRSWVKAQTSLKGKRVFIFVTANRWFYDSHLVKLKALVAARGGEVVDGVTMATNKMSAEQKTEAVRAIIAKMR